MAIWSKVMDWMGISFISFVHFECWNFESNNKRIWKGLIKAYLVRNHVGYLASKKSNYF